MPIIILITSMPKNKIGIENNNCINFTKITANYIIFLTVIKLYSYVYIAWYFII